MPIVLVAAPWVKTASDSPHKRSCTPIQRARKPFLRRRLALFFRGEGILPLFFSRRQNAGETQGRDALATLWPGQQGTAGGRTIKER